MKCKSFDAVLGLRNLKSISEKLVKQIQVVLTFFQLYI